MMNMEFGGEMPGSGSETAPFLTVLKGEDVLDIICLEGLDTLVMGRHHTCDLVVGHASSSRKHIEIQIIHATHEVILTDLCSVHGTWVGGKRLPSMTPTIFKFGVTFQLAASRRVYRIDWQSTESTSERSMPTSSADDTLDIEASSYSESKSLSSLRYAKENQDHRPSAPPLAVDKSFFPQDENESPTVRVKPSPAKLGESRKSLSSPKVSYRENGSVSPAIRSSTVKRSPARLGELRKSLSSPKVLYPQDENLSPVIRNSPAKSGHLTRSASSPNRPMRRLAFSTLQPSVTNVRSPSSPSVKKLLTERSGSSGSLKLPPSPRVPLNKPKTVAREVTTPSKLWLRRCSSSPLPALATGDETSRPQASKLAALVEAQGSIGEGVETSIAESGDAEYPSDKENVDPKISFSKVSSKSMERVTDSLGGATSRESSVVESIVREPFRPLYCTSLDVRPLFHQLQQSGSNASSEDDYGSKVLGLPRPHHRISSASQNLDQTLRRLKLSDYTEGRRQWHVVVDTNSLLDVDSLKALKQLEGIRETCIIIPKIVVRDLDRLRQKRGSRSSARAALKWIESCMMKLSTWIHVQSSSETLPVRVTPPVSPAFPHHGDLMSPTNNDFVLECALIFAMTLQHGRVALLTKDTALKIKAMAEGLVSESASEFCESLLSPYSNRFLWAGSTAHGKTWVDRSAENSPVSSYPGAPSSLSHTKHSLEDLRHHVNAQPRGLKLVVTQ